MLHHSWTAICPASPQIPTHLLLLLGEMHLKEGKKHLKISTSGLICSGHPQRHGIAATAASCFALVPISDFSLIPISSDLVLSELPCCRGRGCGGAMVMLKVTRGFPTGRGPPRTSSLWWGYPFRPGALSQPAAL